jgi:excisionase family DNA binding protein
MKERPAGVGMDILDKLDSMVGLASRYAMTTRDPVFALTNLSALAANFVKEHPREAKLAVAVALETAARQFKGISGQSDDDVPQELRQFMVEEDQELDSDEMIGAAEAANRLDVARATIYNWINEGRLIGWRVTRSGIVIPAEQIVGPGELAPGISEVIEEIGDPRAAWRFLTEESPFFDKPARPIDKLKEGEIETVIKAAQSQGDAFT